MPRRRKDSETGADAFQPEDGAFLETDPGISDDPEPTREPKPRPSRPRAGQGVLGSVPLKVYLASCKDKPDQVAGFAHWATAKKLGPLTIKDWRSKREEFNRRPV